jgi:hypothetical protein
MALRDALQISRRLKIVLIVVLVFVGIQYIVAPIVTWQRRTVERVVALQETVARKKLLIGADRQLDSVLDDKIRLRNQLRERFPDDAVDAQGLQLSLQQTVEALAAQFSIGVLNVNWLPGTMGEINRGPVRFRIEATPGMLMQLLHALETAPHFMTVDGVRITTSGARSATLTAEMDVSAYSADRKQRP